jgi:hypothetical protein
MYRIAGFSLKYLHRSLHRSGDPVSLPTSQATGIERSPAMPTISAPISTQQAQPAIVASTRHRHRKITSYAHNQRANQHTAGTTGDRGEHETPASKDHQLRPQSARQPAHNRHNRRSWRARDTGIKRSPATPTISAPTSTQQGTTGDLGEHETPASKDHQLRPQSAR